jgi:hypothetical protein
VLAGGQKSQAQGYLVQDACIPNALNPYFRQVKTVPRPGEWNMRKLIAICLITAAAACSNSTAPGSTVISIKLLDDGGASAGRNQIVITQTDGSKVTARTGNDGKANVNVEQAGDYVVSVIQRSSFVGSDALTRSVSVTANTRTEMEFILYRRGASTFDPPDVTN